MRNNCKPSKQGSRQNIKCCIKFKDCVSVDLWSEVLPKLLTHILCSLGNDHSRTLAHFWSRVL